MAHELGQPFESVESAKEFLDLLEESIHEALRDVEDLRVNAGQDDAARREQALQLVAHKLKQLSTHTGRSRRILNDLRTLRRLLFDERSEKLRANSANSGSE